MKKNDSRVLIILGMHRSGTSLITQWLFRCGLQIGSRLMGPDTGNLDGHYEDMDFFELHQKILNSKNACPSGLIEETNLFIDEQDKARIYTLIQKKHHDNKQWGWKDPRTCLFSEAYFELMPYACFVFIIRSPKEVVYSLLMRDLQIKEQQRHKQYSNWWEDLKWKLYQHRRMKREYIKEKADFYLNVYIHYNKKLLLLLQKLSTEKYLIANYRNLQRSDQRVYTKLVDQWGFDLDYVPFTSVYKPLLMHRGAHQISHYLNNKQLIRASRLEKELMAFENS